MTLIWGVNILKQEGDVIEADIGEQNQKAKLPFDKRHLFKGPNMEYPDTGPPKKESLIIAGYTLIIEEELLLFRITPL